MRLKLYVRGSWLVINSTINFRRIKLEPKQRDNKYMHGQNLYVMEDGSLLAIRCNSNTLANLHNQPKGRRWHIRHNPLFGEYSPRIRLVFPQGTLRVSLHELKFKELHKGMKCEILLVQTGLYLHL